jgi:hypothetical protein
VGPAVLPVEVCSVPLETVSVFVAAILRTPVDELPSRMPPEIVMPLDIVWPVAPLPIL